MIIIFPLFLFILILNFLFLFSLSCDDIIYAFCIVCMESGVKIRNSVIYWKANNNFKHFFTTFCWVALIWRVESWQIDLRILQSWFSDLIPPCAMSRSVRPETDWFWLEIVWRFKNQENNYHTRQPSLLHSAINFVNICSSWCIVLIK